MAASLSAIVASNTDEKLCLRFPLPSMSCKLQSREENRAESRVRRSRLFPLAGGGRQAQIPDEPQGAAVSRCRVGPLRMYADDALLSVDASHAVPRGANRVPFLPPPPPLMRRSASGAMLAGLVISVAGVAAPEPPRRAANRPSGSALSCGQRLNLR